MHRWNATAKINIGVCLLLLIMGILSLQGRAQDTPSRPLTWDEVKRVQAEERTHVQNAQKDMLDKLVETQLHEMKLMGSAVPTPTQIRELVQEHARERLELAKTHSDERSKLVTTHSQERIAFRQKPESSNKEK